MCREVVLYSLENLHQPKLQQRCDPTESGPLNSASNIVSKQSLYHILDHVTINS